MAGQNYSGGKKLVSIEDARRKRAIRQGKALDRRQAKMSGPVKTRFVDPTTLRRPAAS